MRILNKNQPSSVESMHVSLTSKYGSQVLLATHTTIFWFASLFDKKSDHNDKLLSTEATFGFCLLC